MYGISRWEDRVEHCLDLPCPPPFIQSYKPRKPMNYFCYDCEGYHELGPNACHYHRRYWKY